MTSLNIKDILLYNNITLSNGPLQMIMLDKINNIILNKNLQINNSIEYKHTNKNSNNICIICLEDHELNDKIIILSCYHKFHKKCILEWLNNNPICPICRKIQILS